MSEPYYVYVCLACGTQARGPGGHSVAGDDICSCCPIADGQPKLARISARIADEGTSSHLWRARKAAEEVRKKRQQERTS